MTRLPIWRTDNPTLAADPRKDRRMMVQRPKDEMTVSELFGLLVYTGSLAGVCLLALYLMGDLR
jgi:hypothetical protein